MVPLQIQVVFCTHIQKTCEALRRTIAGESIRIIWKENKSDRWMKIWQKSESKTLKLSFCFLCNSCLLISVVYFKNYLWRVTWIINRVKRICQRRCSMIHFSTNTTANITAWNTVIITIAMENPMSVKRVFYQIIRVKQYNHKVSY